MDEEDYSTNYSTVYYYIGYETIDIPVNECFFDSIDSAAFRDTTVIAGCVALLAIPFGVFVLRDAPAPAAKSTVPSPQVSIIGGNHNPNSPKFNISEFRANSLTRPSGTRTTSILMNDGNSKTALSQSLLPHNNY